MAGNKSFMESSMTLCVLVVEVIACSGLLCMYVIEPLGCQAYAHIGFHIYSSTSAVSLTLQIRLIGAVFSFEIYVCSFGHCQMTYNSFELRHNHDHSESWISISMLITVVEPGTLNQNKMKKYLHNLCW